MKAVVGVDSGGSKTRSIVVSFEGQILGYGESGAGNPGHDDAHVENIQQAIAHSLTDFGVGEIARLVAGIAGFDGDEDIAWVENATSLAPVSGERVLLNDADIALYGALDGRPGIVSVQGAGSMVFGRTEDGTRVRNRDFRHYASAAGPWVGFRCETRLLARGPMPGDEELVAAYLSFRCVDSLERYRQAASQSYKGDYKGFFRTIATMAPAVTAAASKGSPTAIAVCREGASNIVEGIRIVGRMFRGPSIEVILSGSCVRSEFMTATVTSMLSEATEREYRVVAAKYPPLVGAVAMALRQEGVNLSEEALLALSDQITCGSIERKKSL